MATAPSSGRPPAVRPLNRGHRFSRRLTIYVGLDILKVFGLIFLILEVIHGSVFTIQAVREYGFDPILLFPVFWRTFAYALYHSIPISLLLATGLVYGRLIADREIAAMKCFGISHLEIILAPMALGGLFLGIGFLVNNYLVPEIHFARKNLGSILLDQLQYLGEGWDKSLPLRDDLILHLKRYQDSKLSGIFLFIQDLDEFKLGKEGGEGRSRRKEAPDDPGSYPGILYAEEGEVITRTADGKPQVLLDLNRISLIYDNRHLQPKAENQFFNLVRSDHAVFPVTLPSKGRALKSMPGQMLLDEIERRRVEMEDVERNAAYGADARRNMRRSLMESRTEYHRRWTYAGINLTFPVAMALIALALNSTNRLLPFFIGTTACASLFFGLELQGNRIAVGWGMPILEQLGNFCLLAVSAALLAWLELLRNRGSMKKPELRRARLGHAR